MSWYNVPAFDEAGWSKERGSIMDREEHEMLDWVAEDSAEYELAYEVVRCAMRLFDGPDLEGLQAVLHKAALFVNEELDELPEQAQALGLDIWQQEQQERAVQERKEEQKERRAQDALGKSI
jgi:hypothetical protein